MEQIGQVSKTSRITAETPLSEINLNWYECDLPEQERTKHVHRLHPYLGKFIPQIVEVFLRKFFSPRQTILDPFAGSGTTLVQANELGIHSIGYDISAFNVLLMKAKTKHYHLKSVKHQILDILQKTEAAFTSENNQLNLWPISRGEKHDQTSDIDSIYLKQWFAPQALRELIFYRDLITNYEDQEILKIILSRSARSARLTTHFNLDFPKKPQTEPYWCYKHRRICIPTMTALQFLQRYSLDTFKRLEQFSATRTDANVWVVHGDSQRTEFPPIDGVITSPPYLGLIDYHGQHQYAYELLNLEDQSIFEIGAAKQGSGKRAQTEYTESIAKVFKNALNAMPSGGRLIIVANDRYKLYDDIATICNVEVEAILQRHVNRRTGRRSSDFYESIFIWRKH